MLDPLELISDFEIKKRFGLKNANVALNGGLF